MSDAPVAFAARWAPPGQAKEFADELTVLIMNERQIGWDQCFIVVTAAIAKLTP